MRSHCLVLLFLLWQVILSSAAFKMFYLSLPLNILIFNEIWMWSSLYVSDPLFIIPNRWSSYFYTEYIQVIFKNALFFSLCFSPLDIFMNLMLVQSQLLISPSIWLFCLSSGCIISIKESIDSPYLTSLKYYYSTIKFALFKLELFSSMFSPL